MGSLIADERPPRARPRQRERAPVRRRDRALVVATTALAVAAMHLRSQNHLAEVASTGDRGHPPQIRP